MNSDIKQSKGIGSQKLNLLSSSEGFIKNSKIFNKNTKITKKFFIKTNGISKEDEHTKILTIKKVKSKVNYDSFNQRKKKKRLKVRVKYF